MVSTLRPRVTLARSGYSIGLLSCSSTLNVVTRTGTIRPGPHTNSVVGAFFDGTGVAAADRSAQPDAPPPPAPIDALTEIDSWKPPASADGYSSISSAASRSATPASTAIGGGPG